MSPQAASAALGWFLLPTCWEIEVTCAAAMILVALYAAFDLLAPRPSSAGNSADDLQLARDLDAADKVTAQTDGRLRVREIWAVLINCNGGG